MLNNCLVAILPNSLRWPAVSFFLFSGARVAFVPAPAYAPVGPIAILGLIIGALLFVPRNWARTVALILVPVLAVALIAEMFVSSFAPLRLIGLLLLLGWLTWAAHRIWTVRGEKELISLVWLLAQPRHLEVAILRQIVESAWNVQLRMGEDEDETDADEPDDEDESEGFIAGEEPIFMVSARGGLFSINSFPRPYVDDPEQVAAETKNRRLARILELHKAWVSVDWFFFHDGSTDHERAYREIARLMADLAAEDCLGLYCPETQQMVPYRPELVDELRAGKAKALFSTSDQPVLAIPDDDPRMIAAIEEARRTWPEFLAAVHKHVGENHAIKVPLSSEGRTEYIWVDVEGISGDVIFGKLGNKPVDLPGFKLGDPIEVELKEVKDWGYILDGQPRGMFTTKVLLAHNQP